jgi:hypothetical protein
MEGALYQWEWFQGNELPDLGTEVVDDLMQSLIDASYEHTRARDRASAI